jgi:hypothetical protein
MLCGDCFSTLELRLNATYQFLAYDDDFNLLGDNIDTTKKSTGTLTDTY